MLGLIDSDSSELIFATLNQGHDAVQSDGVIMLVFHFNVPFHHTCWGEVVWTLVLVDLLLTSQTHLNGITDAYWLDEA